MLPGAGAAALPFGLAPVPPTRSAPFSLGYSSKAAHLSRLTEAFLGRRAEGFGVSAAHVLGTPPPSEQWPFPFLAPGVASP